MVLAKKSLGDLQQARGRMIGLEDRQMRTREIGAARHVGARPHKACQIAGVDARAAAMAGPRPARNDCSSPAVLPTPIQGLSDEERDALLRVANELRFGDLHAARILPALADGGLYLAS
jgi:putative transposase